MLLAVAGEDTEPILAAAAMQALTAMVGSADAKAMLLQHPGFLDTLLMSVNTGCSLHPPTSACAHICQPFLSRCVLIAPVNPRSDDFI